MSTATQEPETKDDWRLESLDKLAECEDALAELDLHLDSAKERVKELKGQHKLYSNRMRKIARELSHPDEEAPLFNGKGKATVEDESWRNVPLDEAAGFRDLPKKVRRCIADHPDGLDTVGKLADWKNAKRDRVWNDIPGIGPKAAEQIDAAFDAFWAWWKTQTTTEAAPPASDVQDAEFQVKGLLPAPEANGQPSETNGATGETKRKGRKGGRR